jgi:hypothetical protein
MGCWIWRFLPPLRRIVAALPRRRLTLLFSATLSDAIIGVSAEFTRDAVRVDVSVRQVVAATVTHQVHDVAVDRTTRTNGVIDVGGGNRAAAADPPSGGGAARAHRSS